MEFQHSTCALVTGAISHVFAIVAHIWAEFNRRLCSRSFHFSPTLPHMYLPSILCLSFCVYLSLAADQQNGEEKVIYYSLE